MLGNKDRNKCEALPAVLIDFNSMYADIVQQVERLICNQLVAGSSPVVGLTEHSAFGDSLLLLS